MTDFKVGDRVKVEFEGVVQEYNPADPEGLEALIDVPHQPAVWLNTGVFTKIQPKPQPGDVWRGVVPWSSRGPLLGMVVRDGSESLWLKLTDGEEWEIAGADFSGAELLFRLPEVE